VTIYFIKQATPDDFLDLLNIIVESFIELDPFTNYLDVKREEFRYYIEPYIHASIQQGFAFIVRDTDGKCIAVSTYHETLSDITWDKNKLSLNIQAVISFYESLHYCVDDYLQTHRLKLVTGLILCAGFLAIHPHYFGTNIPHEIDKILWPLAKQHGFRFIMAEFTNPCSYHLYQRKFGDKLNVLKAFPYRDYLDESQSRPFEKFNGEYILSMINLNSITYHT
jgi:hypothetical protein